MGDYIKKTIKRIKWKRFCKLNGYDCPNCIHHDFVFDRNHIFRGNRCRSECGTAFSDEVCYMMRGDSSYHEPKHCLWCGAIMDGGIEE